MAATGAGRQIYRAFCGNLPWTIGSTELRHFASSFGPVVNSNVIFDRKTGLSKGYGFVSFGTREGFNAFTKGGTGTYLLEGSYINVSATASGNVSSNTYSD